MYLLCATGTVVYLLGVISFYRLLWLYEKGAIFSGANGSGNEKLGSYLAGYGILAIAANVIYLGGIIFPWVLLEGIASPWIVVGGAIYNCCLDHGRGPENSGGTGTDRLTTRNSTEYVYEKFSNQAKIIKASAALRTLTFALFVFCLLEWPVYC